jgi:hypothetical protein
MTRVVCTMEDGWRNHQRHLHLEIDDVCDPVPYSLEISYLFLLPILDLNSALRLLYPFTLYPSTSNHFFLLRLSSSFFLYSP